MNNTKTMRSHTMKCGLCKAAFETDNRGHLAASNMGNSVYCSPKCANASQNAKYNNRYTLGPCPTCGKMFGSRTKHKKYCCLKCYTSSTEMTERLREENEKKTIPPSACPNCGEMFKKRKNKYCSDACRRKFFASRFDRWIASPEGIALPQNFDEFMAKDRLPCLVDGCNWEGENLANHVNFTHGITADKFRELAGFNKSTGLVGAELRTKISERITQMIEDGIIPIAPENLDSVDRSAPRGTPSLEAKEHRHKSMVMAMAMAENEPKRARKCRVCAKDVIQPVFGRVLYCSTVCRSKYYQEHGVGELSCDFCGQMFDANVRQIRRAKNGHAVCCSKVCANRLNIGAALAIRGIEYNGKPNPA